jgi:hypothetical protein
MGAQLVIEALLLHGQTDDALTALEDAAHHGLMDITWVNRCPLLAVLATYPRFLPVRYEIDARASRVRAMLAATQA